MKLKLSNYISFNINILKKSLNILNHIKNNQSLLIEKYDKFKLRTEIINDPNKKIIPN